MIVAAGAAERIAWRNREVLWSLMGHHAGRRGGRLQMRHLAVGPVSFEEELEVFLLMPESCQFLLQSGPGFFEALRFLDEAVGVVHSPLSTPCRSQLVSFPTDSPPLLFFGTQLLAPVGPPATTGACRLGWQWWRRSRRAVAVPGNHHLWWELHLLGGAGWKPVIIQLLLDCHYRWRLLLLLLLLVLANVDHRRNWRWHKASLMLVFHGCRRNSLQFQK